MLNWLLFVIALAAALLGSLTVCKSPDWSEWKLAILAGEYGHWLALVPLAVSGLAWLRRGDSVVLASATVLVGVVALALLLGPSVYAWRLGRALPAQLTRQFGPVDLRRAPFSLAGLLGAAPKPVPVETMKFSGDLALDFYRAVDQAHAPCVILVHGGGWDGGARTEIAQFNHWLARRGYAVAAIDYRLAPQSTWPAQRDDVLAALTFLKTHAVPLGIDPSRLVLAGRSAGGNIAEAVGYTISDISIRGVIALYAPADLHFAWAYAREDDVLKSPVLLKQFLGGVPETAREAYDNASGYLHVGPHTPPTLLLHGQLDTLVWHRQSERLDARLTEYRVPHDFISLPWATHAFEFNLSGPGGQLTTYSVEWFLAAVTR